MKFMILGSLLITSVSFAGSNSYCGRKMVVEGETVLVDAKDREILQLTEQGGSKSLLEQANQIIGRGGMKAGESYCLTVMMNAAGTPIKVLKARPDVLAKGKKEVAPPEADKVKIAPVAGEKQTEKLKEVKEIKDVE